MAEVREVMVVELFRMRYDDKTTVSGLATVIGELIAGQDEIAVVCVGSDRGTGDALGPLVGTELAGLQFPGVTVYGTLDDTVHAGNLDRTVKEITGRFVIAVDACLDRQERVGTVAVRPGPLTPGTGVGKSLPRIGEFHVIGVVNVSGFMEYFVLQSTPLSLVLQMARVIAAGLAEALQVWSITRKAACVGAQTAKRG